MIKNVVFVFMCGQLEDRKLRSNVNKAFHSGTLRYGDIPDPATGSPHDYVVAVSLCTRRHL